MRTTIIAAALATTCLCASALAQSNAAQQQGPQGQATQTNMQSGSNTAARDNTESRTGQVNAGAATQTTGQGASESNPRAAEPNAAAGQSDTGPAGGSANMNRHSSNPTTAASTDESSSPNGNDVQAQSTETGGKVHYVTNNNRSLWSAKKLDGVYVYNDQNKNIGSIEDVLVDRDGRVEAVVIGVGGFLGIGQHDVAVSFNSLQWQMNKNNNNGGQTTGAAAGASGNNAAGGDAAKNRDAPARAILPGATQDTLKKAPEFKYAD